MVSLNPTNVCFTHLVMCVCVQEFHILKLCGYISFMFVHQKNLMTFLDPTNFYSKSKKSQYTNWLATAAGAKYIIMLVYIVDLPILWL